MKNTVTVVSGYNTLCFYLKTPCQTVELFTQPYSSSVYRYFKGGRSLNEVFNFHKWTHNPRLDKTIENVADCSRIAMRRLARSMQEAEPEYWYTPGAERSLCTA